MKIFSLMIFLLMDITTTGAQSFSCDASLSTPLCPGTVAKCNCTVTSKNVGITRWRFMIGPNNLCVPLDLVQTSNDDCSGRNMTCGSNLAVTNQPSLNHESPCNTSTLTINATSNVTGVLVICIDDPSTAIGSINIDVVAPPGPPNVMAQTIGPDMVQVVVSPSPNGGLPTSYNVTISNSSYTSSHVVMANGSAIVNFTGLRNDTTYNISVMAINCAGNNSTTWPASSPSPPTTSSVPLTSSTPTPTTPNAGGPASSPSPPTTSSVPLTSSTPTPTTPNAGASAIGPIVGGVVGGVIFIVIVIIIIILIVFIVLKKPNSTSKTPDDVPLKKKNSSTPATPTSVDRDSPPPPPPPSRDTPPSPPPGPNTEAEYSTVDSSKKPQNQGIVYASVGTVPPASSQQ